MARRGSRRRWALAAALVSLVLWVGWRATHDPGPTPSGDLSRGKFTDHTSHLSTTRLFWKVGLDLYRRPIASHGRALTPRERTALPPDIDPSPTNREVWHVDGWPDDKPLVASWTSRPRMHPPGDHLLLAPVALLYQETSLSFTGANRLLILLFLVYAHVSIFVLFDTFARDGRRAIGPGLLVTALVYLEAIHWSLEGFYEAATIGPLLLAARALASRRWLAAGLAYAVAITIHFRVLFLFPWAVVALGGALHDRAWRTWRGKDWIVLAATVLLVGASLMVFVVLWPTLRSLDVAHNPVSWTSAGDPRSRAAFVGVAVGAALACAWARAWVDVIVVAWMTLMFVALRESYEWDILSALAWLPAPVIGWRRSGAATSRIRREDVTRGARLFFMFFGGVLIFRNDLVPMWIRHL